MQPCREEPIKGTMMSLDSSSHPRNPAHPQALGLNDLTPGREVTVCHLGTGRKRSYVVESEPFVAYDGGAKTPRGDWDHEALYVSLRSRNGDIVDVQVGGMGVIPYEGGTWNTWCVTVDSNNKNSLHVDPKLQRKWRELQEESHRARVRELEWERTHSDHGQ